MNDKNIFFFFVLLPLSLIACSGNESTEKNPIVSVEESLSNGDENHSSSLEDSINQSMTSSNSKASSSSKKQQSSSSATSSSSKKQQSSSSESSSSDTIGISSYLYNCEECKCITTKYLNPNINYDEYLDVRDSQVYRTVSIGNQVWIAQNLNYKADSQSFCFDSDSLYCKEKGRLYTWDVAKKVCPEGWHLPDTTEYNALIDFVEGNSNGLTTKESLQSGEYDIFGFSIIPGSGYVVRGEYSHEGGPDGSSYFWTASETDGLDSSRPSETYARARGLRTNSDNFIKISWEKIHALSVRCLKNYNNIIE